MKIREQAINELKNMNSSELMIVYDLILSLKRGIASSRAKDIGTPSSEEIKPYIAVRNALKGLENSLSEDIIIARNERI